MALYNPQNPVAAAQAAMGAASQTAAAQTKQTTRTTKKDTSAWDDFLAGATGVARLAQGLHGLTNAAEDVVQIYDSYKLRDAYDAIDNTFAKEGFEGIQSNPDMQDYWHSKALGQFMLDRAKSGKGRLEMMKNMDAANDKLYQDWRIGAMATQKAFNSGDMQQFMPAMQELSAKSPLPYKLEPDGNGNFRVMFRSDAHGGWTDTGNAMTPQEAMAQVNSMMKGEQMILRGADGKTAPVNPGFLAAAARYQYGTMMGNAQNRLDPKKQIQLVGRDGKPAGIGVIQNSIDDYGAGPMLMVYDNNGKQIGAYDGFDGAMQAGFRPAGVKTKGSGTVKPSQYNTAQKKLFQDELTLRGYYKMQGQWVDGEGAPVPQDEIQDAYDSASESADEQFGIVRKGNSAGAKDASRYAEAARMLLAERNKAAK